jgi:hypothetical protein
MHIVLILGCIAAEITVRGYVSIRKVMPDLRNVFKTGVEVVQSFIKGACVPDVESWTRNIAYCKRRRYHHSSRLPICGLNSIIHKLSICRHVIHRLARLRGERRIPCWVTRLGRDNEERAWLWSNLGQATKTALEPASYQALMDVGGQTACARF